MTVFRRTLLVWAVFVSVFLAIVIGLSQFGGRVVDTMNTYSYFEAAKTHVAQNEHEDAVEDLLKILEVSPADIEVRFMLVESLMHLGKFRDARTQCEQLLENSSNEERVDSLRLQGRISLAMGLWEEAQTDLRTVAEALPNDAEVHFELARIAEELGQYASMSTSLNRIAEIAAGNSSNEYITLLSDRLEVLKKRVASEPTPEVYYYLGMAHRVLGQWNAAIEAFEESDRLPSTPADASYWLGVNAEMNQDVEAAVAHYTRALDRNSTHYRANRNLLRLLVE